MEKNPTLVQVTKSYSAQYLDPIILQPGDHVRLGEEETDPNWKGWVWAETDTHKGWIPMQILDINPDRTTGRVLQPYSAKELDVLEGEFVKPLQTLNGWTWAQHHATGDEGWIPNEILSVR